MTGALAALGLALASPVAGVLVAWGWVLGLTVHGRPAGGAALGTLLLAAAVLVLEPSGSPALVAAVLATTIGVGAGLGALRFERYRPLAVLLVLGCVWVFLAQRPAPAHGGGVEALLEGALRAPVAPLALGLGVCLALSASEGPLALLGGATVVVALAIEGRPRILEAGQIAALIAGGVLAGIPRVPALGVAVLAAAPLVVSAVGVRPAVDPYGLPMDLPRSRSAVLDVRVGGAALVSGLAVADDGTVYYGEMASGRIVELPPEARGAGVELARIALPRIQGARASYELGLWGLAVDPRGEWVYAMAVHRWDEDDPDPAARSSRIVRVRRRGPERGAVQDVVTGLPAGPIHSGGTLAFGPDGLLYVTLGDGLRHGPRGESPSEPLPGPGILSGSVLRLDPDGAEPEPVAYAWGFRNPYGQAFDPAGTLWVTDNGPDCCDRLMRVSPGAHHGWPPGPEAGVEPVWTSGGYRPGVTGVAVLGPAYGALEGDLLFATWHSGALHRVRLRDEEVVEHAVVLDVPPARPDPAAPYRFAGAFTALAVGPDGRVWFSTVNAVGRIVSLGGS